MITSSPPGLVIWITGISGAGKTTTARALTEQLRAAGKTVVHLDGDELREIVGDKLGYSESERLQNAFRISRFCKFLHDQGLLVVCSTMSLFPEIWELNRSSMQNYFEIFLRTSLETARLRDPKGHYERSKDLVGVDLSLNEPTHPDLVLSGEGAAAAPLAENCKFILQALRPKLLSIL